MKRLISLMIAAPLIVACGSDSDSDGTETKLPTLPSLQLRSTNNETANGSLGLATGFATGAVSALAAYGDSSYSSSGNTETWTYTVEGLTVTLVYTDGSSQDSWQLTLDGSDGQTTYSDWLAWSMTQQEADDSVVMSFYEDNSADLEAQVEASEDRVKLDSYDGGALDSTIVVVVDSETSGRLLTQDAGEQITAFTWSGDDQVATYFNCGTNMTVLETAVLPGELCSTALAEREFEKVAQPVAEAAPEKF